MRIHIDDSDLLEGDWASVVASLLDVVFS